MKQIFNPLSGKFDAVGMTEKEVEKRLQEVPDAASEIAWQNNSGGAISNDVVNVQQVIDNIVGKVYYVAPAVTNLAYTLASGSAQPLRTNGANVYFYEKLSNNDNPQIAIGSLSWTLNKNGIAVTLQINNEPTINLEDNAIAYTTAISNNEQRTGDITLKITATDNQQNTASALLYFKKALRKVYYGFHADTSTYDEIFIKALASSLKLSNELKSKYTLNTNETAQGAYIAVPANWAQPTACTVDGAVGDEDVTLVASNIAVADNTGNGANAGIYNVYRVVPEEKYSATNFQKFIFTLK